jgi:2-dehydropantoate 2-reductase
MSNNVTHPDTEVSWHVLGAGAMGCLWAAYLSTHLEAGRQGTVTLLFRSQQALQKYPGHVTLERAGKTQQLVVAGRRAKQLTHTISHLLVATKAQDAISAIESVADHLSDQTVLVLLQNGIKVQRQICERFGSHRTWCISTSHGAWLRAPAHVVHAGVGSAWLGQLEANTLSPAASQAAATLLMRLLPAQPLNLSHDPDIHSRLWQKFAINCAINPLTVLHDCPNGELLSRPTATAELAALTLVAGLPGAPAMPDLPEQVNTVLRQTSANISSTLQDIRGGRRTEIHHLNGYLCELAQASQLPCPVNRQMLQAVQRLESEKVTAQNW